MTGATGLIGKELGQALHEKGHQIFVVSRDEEKAKAALSFPVEVVVGDLNKGPLVDSRLDSMEVIYNLMGEPIDSRWSETKKKSIYESRVLGTRNLVQSLKYNPQVIISASAMGFYGDRKDEPLDEMMKHGEDFLAHVCRDWETEAAHLACRKVFLRTGIVLAESGGALQKMILPFRLGLGGALGDGKQWMSWIHLKDIVGLYVVALENPEVHGPINGAAPEPVTNSIFSEILAGSLGNTKGPTVPEFALKLLFGEMSSVLLGSQRSDPTKVKNLGYEFQFKTLKEALNEINK